MGNNWNKYGFSCTMGPTLRELVQIQLADELNSLLGMSIKFDIDWSDSCIEGHDGEFLDGSLENYSGIKLTNKQAFIKADGCMEFIEEEDFFLAYWDHITVWQNDKELFSKDFGISSFAYVLVPEELRWHLKGVRKH
ncbi:hypothetical protein SF1_14310 [Sphingobacterium faecium NBRC 15299]|uniref:hypothetical protein n=1 Tax=Sphingobacterium faecium TaxID=34087 RepID=UPI000D4E83AF|nr:hypothetical protein [Sphingobacterium faecium]PTX11766.1 hypothetical protein C8N37_103343 [Sphingobacterium faecium]GEM63449.1 hypothetical protein SF1_14310 [Sphingobacterium faecium NBRC 15299]